MNTKHGIILVGIGLLLFCVFFIGTASAKTWYVDDDGGADFTKIQDAIDAASDGDTIYVYNGTYNGNLYIWKSITLQGENPKETFVKLIQSSSSDIIVADTEDVIVSGFTMISNNFLFDLEETHLSGIELYHVNNCTVSNNTVSDFWGGIGGSEFSFCNFMGNDISNNTYGIYVWNCSYSKIADNSVYSNEKGIANCSWSCNNTVTNNSIFLNGLGASTGNYCDFNRIYHNDFVENDEQAYNWNYRTNFWDDGYTSGGNYWHDHSCSGNPSDGSQPYYIKYGAQDSYPFEDPNGWLLGKNIFETGSPANPYPSISGTHNGTITPNQTIIASKLYTYPCCGTGGHTESIELYENDTLIANGTWNGYEGDWHNITIHNLTGGAPYVTLLENYEYNYTIRTGSYPQIHHTSALPTKNGWINCTDFIDANGKRYNDRIPAIRLW